MGQSHLGSRGIANVCRGRFQDTGPLGAVVEGAHLCARGRVLETEAALLKPGSGIRGVGWRTRATNS